MNELLEKLALAKWKEMIHTLNESNQLRLRTPQVQKVKEIPSEVKARMQNDKMKDYFEKDYKVHDYERELVGLERGSDEIVRKISPDTKIVREIEDIDDAAEAVAQKHVDVIGTHSKEDVEKHIKDTLLNDGAISNVYGHGNVVRDDIGFISKGNLSRESFESSPLNIDRDWDKYVNNERSLAQRYADAVKVRHEADELKFRIKNRLNRGYIKDRNTGASGDFIDLTNTSFAVGNRSNHISPEVLVNESAYIALAPEAVQDVFKNVRLLSNENRLIPDYGINATIDKKQTNKAIKIFSKNVEQAIRNDLNNKYGQNKYFIKPIPLGPVKQSSLRTRYLEN